MTAQTWHLDHDVAERYTSGQVGRVASASIEQHLIGCGTCRDLLTPFADQQRATRVWSDVLDEVQAPRPRALERVLRRCGVADTTARLLAVTPTLRGSWLTGVLFVLVLAQFAAQGGPRGIVLFMALAPVLPLISVAAAFDGDLDPSREMAGATPYPVLRLLLVRTGAVVISTLVPATALALLLPGSAWLALGWLLPSLALIGAVLALAPRMPALPTSGVLATSWMALVGLGWIRQHDPYLAASLTVQVASLALLLSALVLLLVRRENVAEEIRRPA